MAQLRLGYPEIQRGGAEVLQITHNTAAEAQRYFKHYPIAFPYLCDPDRTVHERYGIAQEAPTLSESLKTIAAVTSDRLRGDFTPSPLPAIVRAHGRESPQAV